VIISCRQNSQEKSVGLDFRKKACVINHVPVEDPDMRKRYKKLKNRKGGEKAIVAVARILIIHVRRILLDNEPHRLKAA